MTYSGGQNVRNADVGDDDAHEWSWFNEQQNIEKGRGSDDDRFGPEGSADGFNYLDIGHEFWNQDRLSDRQLDTYETWYIDALYNTTDRRWESGREPSGSDVDLRIGTEDVQAHWGIDLVRVAYEEEPPTVPNQHHFEWVTRGRVDWAHYRESSVYQNAWASMTSDGDYRTQSENHSWDTGDWVSFWDRSSDVDKVSWIRDVNARIDSGELDETGSGTDEDFWTTWDNQYTSEYIHESMVDTEQEIGGVMTTVTSDMVGTSRDPENAYSYQPIALFTAASMEDRVTARLNATEAQATTHPAITAQPATPTPVTSRPDINIQTVNIERPANIPAAWGEV